MAEEQESPKHNPIDPDDVTDNPGGLAYPHHRGSSAVRPVDQNEVRKGSLNAMEAQTDQQLGQIYEQMHLLASQAKRIEARKAVSEMIYQTDFRFKPEILHTYHLYRMDEKLKLSLIAPEEWNSRKSTPHWIATIKLLPDHTWELLDHDPEQFSF